MPQRCCGKSSSRLTARLRGMVVHAAPLLPSAAGYAGALTTLALDEVALQVVRRPPMLVLGVPADGRVGLVQTLEGAARARAGRPADRRERGRCLRRRPAARSRLPRRFRLRSPELRERRARGSTGRTGRPSARRSGRPRGLGGDRARRRAGGGRRCRVLGVARRGGAPRVARLGPANRASAPRPGVGPVERVRQPSSKKARGIPLEWSFRGLHAEQVEPPRREVEVEATGAEVVAGAAVARWAEQVDQIV
jgi:hypothetical protein